MSDRPPLLQVLAASPWLQKHGEVLAVQALVSLLAEPTCRRAMQELICERSGVRVPDDATWQAEAVTDGGRPDLSAVTRDNQFAVIVEAKFDHLITPGQLLAYQAMLKRGRGQSDRALLLLVPEHRRGEAEQALPAGDATTARTGVLSWDQVIFALQSACGADPLLAGDLRQFAGLCEAYIGRDILPFSKDQLVNWHAREQDLQRLIDRVTAELSGADRLFPIGVEKDGTADGHGFYRRYVSLWTENRGPYLAVGVREPFVAFPAPVCVRYHRATDDFTEVKERLCASTLGAVVNNQGHVHVPLTLRMGVAGATLVADLVRQVRVIHAVALARPELAKARGS